MNLEHSHGSAQTLRLRRFWIASRVFYGTALALLAVAYLLDLVAPRALAASAGAFVFTVLALYVCLSSGANLRFADPDLHTLQAYAAVSTALFAAYQLDDGRGLWLLLAASPLVFNAYPLRRADLSRLMLFTLAAYALVINLIMHLRPGAVQNVHVEWFSWIVLAGMMLGFTRLDTRLGSWRLAAPAATQAGADPTNDPTTQRQRITRFLIAARTYYGMAFALLTLAYAFGLIAPAPALAAVIVFAAINLGLYLVLRSGINQRLRDPGLTLVQSLLAITAAMFVTYHLDDGRGLWLLLCLSPFLFGIYQLERREFSWLALYATAAYALVVNLVMHFRPQAVHSVVVEWFSWAALAVVLTGVVALAARLGELRRHLVSRTQALSAALDRVNTMATRDALTGLYNRAVFTESLRHGLAQSERHGRPLALLFIDVDRFKQINDAHGHQAGDAVLCELARRIASVLRGSDVVGRLGGDEFVVMLEDFQSLADVVDVAEKIVAAAAAPIRVSGSDADFSVSVGIAVAPQHGRSEVVLMRSADAAMYQAKSEGRNRVAVYADGLGVDAVDRARLQADLTHAVAANQLRLHYLPKVTMASGRIGSVEALLSWEHPERGTLSPEQFMPLAEDSGDVLSIGRWTLREACAQARRWDDSRGLRLDIAVNLSPRQLRDPDLAAQVAEALRESAFDPRRLELEITENTLMLNPDHALEQMARLRAQGNRLVLDDFGTGYSSLSVLRRFPGQEVKIDRSLIAELPSTSDDAALTRAIIAMAHHLGFGATAEGVETAAQLEFLRAEGCDAWQGFWCSRPLAGEALGEFVSAHRRR